jgi:hypothetical protein
MVLAWFAFLDSKPKSLGDDSKKKLRAIPRPVGPSGAGDE